MNKAYFLPIMQTRHLDSIEMNINLFCNKGFIDLNKFNWLGLKSSELVFDERISKDLKNPRICELEAIKYKWVDISLHKNSKDIFSQIKSLFYPIFDIEKVLYNDISQLIFKVYLNASRTGYNT
jgi:hypothetical protein